MDSADFSKAGAFPTAGSFTFPMDPGQGRTGTLCSMSLLTHQSSLLAIFLGASVFVPELVGLGIIPEDSKTTLEM